MNSKVPLPKTGIPIPDLPPPSIYKEESFDDYWKDVQYMSPETVFGLEWMDEYLVGCTASGFVVLWKIQDEEEKLEPDFKKLKVGARVPVVKFRASKGTLYNVRVVETSSSTFIGVCGDQGVLIYSWADFEDLLDGKIASEELEPLLHLRPKDSPRLVEINDIDADDVHIYGASGDGFGCYKWNFDGEFIASYPSSRKGGLHSVKVLPKSEVSHSVVLVGGEDGALGVWDSSQDKLIENIDVKDAMNNKSNLMRSEEHTGTKFRPWETNISLWISHIDAPTEMCSSFWAVCGGAEGGSKRGGFVTTWHAQTRSLFCGTTTRETPQRMVYNGVDLTTIANEGVVSHWTPSTLERASRVWSSPPSSYAIAAQEDGPTAIGGVGGVVDIFSPLRNKLYSLSVK